MISTPLAGLGTIEVGAQLAQAIQQGQWLQGALAGVGFAPNLGAVSLDPLGPLISAGLSWILDYVRPLSTWFNDLTGDPAEVAAFSQQWAQIGAQLQGMGLGMMSRLSEFGYYSGAMVSAYSTVQHDAITHVNAAGDWANAISEGLQSASSVVQYVHDLVRDALAELVSLAISAMSTSALTFGLGTPIAIGKVVAHAVSLATKLSTTVINLVDSVSTLDHQLSDLTNVMDTSRAAFASAVDGGAVFTRAGNDLIAAHREAAVSADGSMDATATAFAGTSRASALTESGVAMNESSTPEMASSRGAMMAAAGVGIAGVAGAAGASAAMKGVPVGSPTTTPATGAGAASARRTDAGMRGGAGMMGGMPAQSGRGNGKDTDRKKKTSGQRSKYSIPRSSTDRNQHG